MTEGQALALRFKADWEIWSNPMPSKALQAYEAEFREKYFGAVTCLPCYPETLARCSVQGAMAVVDPGRSTPTADSRERQGGRSMRPGQRQDVTEPSQSG